MKKILNIFFVVLGVIFFIIILVATYLFIADPLNLKPIIFPEDNPVTPVENSINENNDKQTEDAVDKKPALSDGQEKMLETVGIDPASVPSQITEDQEACFVEILGEARVQEIKDGDTPTVAEFFKARACLDI